MEGLRASLEAQSKAVSKVISSGARLSQLADDLDAQEGQFAQQLAADKAQPVEERKAAAQAEAEAALEAVETADEEALACYAAVEGRIRSMAKTQQSYKKVEAMTAGKFKVKWRHRGPGILDQSQATVPVWRKQKYRSGSNRYANRGGKWREYYAQRPWLWQDNKKGKGKGKVKGKGKSEGKSEGKLKEEAKEEPQQEDWEEPQQEDWEDWMIPEEEPQEEQWEEDWDDPQEWCEEEDWQSSTYEASLSHGPSESSSSSSSHAASSHAASHSSSSSFSSAGLTSTLILGMCMVVDSCLCSL